jgi:hypothetical protein
VTIIRFRQPLSRTHPRSGTVTARSVDCSLTYYLYCCLDLWQSNWCAVNAETNLVGFTYYCLQLTSSNEHTRASAIVIIEKQVSLFFFSFFFFWWHVIPSRCCRLLPLVGTRLGSRGWYPPLRRNGFLTIPNLSQLISRDQAGFRGNLLARQCYHCKSGAREFV